METRSGGIRSHQSSRHRPCDARRLQQPKQRGGVLACGIVPNAQDYNLDGYLEHSIGVFKKEKLFLSNGVLVTPSCGCGTVSEGFAKKTHLLSIDIAEACSSI